MARKAARTPGHGRATVPRTRDAQSARKTAVWGIPRAWFALGATIILVIVIIAAVSLMGNKGGSGSDAIAVLRTSDFHALAFNPADPSTVFFGHHNGVMRSDDGGRTWRQLVDRRNFDAMGLTVSSANPRLVFAAGHDIFQVSTDGGVSWQPVRHNLPGTDIHAFAMSPDDPNGLFAFVVGYGLHQSDDGGRIWRRLSGQLPMDVMTLASAGGSPETLYAGSMNSGLHKSADGGQGWVRLSSLGSRMVMTLAVDPKAPQTIYAGGNGGLYKSTEGGATWSKLPFPGDNVVAAAVSQAKPGLVLAISVQGGQNDSRGLVYRSEDGGLTWGSRAQ